MSRKGVGIASIDRSRLTSQHYASHGSHLRHTHAQHLQTQLSVFRSLLQSFARSHARDIRSDPSFRAQFARMCAAIGVDPLTSSRGGLWAQLLGSVDFYLELAVRVVEICGSSRGENGGLIGLSELRDRLRPAHLRNTDNGGEDDVAEDDVRHAVGTLDPLGAGFAIVKVGRKEYVRSVPRELSTDQAAVVEAAQVLGYVSVGMLAVNLGWEAVRCTTAVEDLVKAGLLWVDEQTRGEWEYWSPGFMFGRPMT